MQLSQAFQDFLKSHAIRKEVNASYSPWQNATVERNVSRVKTVVRKLVYQIGSEWDALLAFICNSINSTPLSYKYSAEYIMFGSSLSTEHEPLQFDMSGTSIENYVKNALLRMQNSRADFEQRKLRKAEQNKIYLNKKTDKRNFEIGEVVFYQNLVLEANKTTKLANIGPAIVLKICTSSQTAVIQHILNKLISKQHFTHLIKYKQFLTTPLPVT